MIVITDPDKRFRTKLAQSLGRPDSLQQFEDVDKLQRAISNGTTGAEVVVFGPDVPQDDAISAAERIARRLPEVSVILVADEVSPELLHRALRSGIRDVVSTDAPPEEIRTAVERVLELSQHLRGRSVGASEQDSTEHKMITVFSSKGGCGKSFVSSNLAILLAQRTGREVVLVDLDLQAGDLAIMFQIVPAWTIYDAAETPERLDSEQLRGYLTKHESGVYLLSAPLEPSLADAISGGAVHRILEILKDTFPYVVVDGPATFNDHVLAALDASDEIVLIASMDVPSIKNLKLALQTLEQLGIPRARTRLLLNRADSEVGLRIGEVEKTLGTVIDVAVPSSREVPLSINHGAPLATQRKRSPVVASIAKLAALVSQAAPAQAAEARRGLWRRG